MKKLYLVRSVEFLYEGCSICIVYCATARELSARFQRVDSPACADPEGGQGVRTPSP